MKKFKQQSILDPFSLVEYEEAEALEEENEEYVVDEESDEIVSEIIEEMEAVISLLEEDFDNEESHNEKNIFCFSSEKHPH